LSNGEAADLVIGQQDFASFIANEDSIDGNPTAAALSFPAGIAVTSTIICTSRTRQLASAGVRQSICHFRWNPACGQSAASLGSGQRLHRFRLHSGGSRDHAVLPQAVGSTRRTPLYRGYQQRPGARISIPASVDSRRRPPLRLWRRRHRDQLHEEGRMPESAQQYSICRPQGSLLDSANNVTFGHWQQPRHDFNTRSMRPARTGRGTPDSDELIGQSNFVSKPQRRASDSSLRSRSATIPGDDLFVRDTSNSRCGIPA